MNTPDFTLLDRWTTSRDAQAFTELVSRHGGMVYNTCRRILRNAADAEEAAHDCFLKLSQGRPPKGRPVGTWLHRVATNGSLDLLRKNRRRTRREAAYADAQPIVGEPDWDDIQHFVDQAIETLPASLRAPIVHHFLEGKTQEETATLAGISRSGVTRRIQRGVERIRQDLARRGVRVTLPALGALLGASFAEAAPVPAGLTAALGKLALAGATRGATTTGAISAFSGWVSGKGVSVWAGLLVIVLAITYVATRLPDVREQLVSSPAPKGGETVENVAAEELPVPSDRTGSAPSPDYESAIATRTEVVEIDDAINGRVVDAVTGEPVLQSVTISGEVAKGFETDKPFGKTIYVWPDENGEFRVDGHKAGYGMFTASVRNSNYYPVVSQEGVRRRGVPTPEIILRVTELPTISGQVLYADGSPVPEASIMRRVLGGNSDTLTSADQGGRFRHHHDGGRWVVFAMKGMLRSDAVTLDLDNESSVSHDFILPPKGGFTLSLDTSDGNVVRDISKSILMTEGMTSPFLLAVRTDKNRFFVDDLPYDRYSVELRAKGYAPTMIENIEVYENHPNPTATARLVPATLHSLTIQAVDANWRGLSDVGIGLLQWEERLDVQGNVQALWALDVTQGIDNNTDANGEWTARNLYAGLYRAYCRDQRGYGEVIIEVPGTAYVTLPLRKDPFVRSRVEFIDPFAGNKPLNSEGGYRFVVRADGTPAGSTSEWGRLQLGWNTVIAIKEGRTAFIDTIHAGSDAPSDGILIEAVLGEAGLISGWIEKPDGGPAAGDYLYVYPEAVWPLAQEAWSDDWKKLGAGLAQGARVGVDGNFVLDYLPEGAYVVALSDMAYSDPVEVKPGYETGPIVLVRDSE